MKQVRGLSIPIGVLLVLSGAVLLAMSGLGQVKNTGTQASSGAAKAGVRLDNIPSCSGVPKMPSSGRALPPANPHPHSVTLKWRAALPASGSPQDLIKGYYVYRSLTSHNYIESNRISASLLQGTQCIDNTVEARKTYFYVVKALSENGRPSDASAEIRVEVPFP
jgi:hypothetical protein